MGSWCYGFSHNNNALEESSALAAASKALQAERSIFLLVGSLGKPSLSENKIEKDPGASTGAATGAATRGDLRSCMPPLSKLKRCVGGSVSISASGRVSPLLDQGHKVLQKGKPH